MSDNSTVREILTEIRDRHGKLTPEIVREEARPPDSPIHSFVFNKDADQAAEEYYLDRAHRLIQSVRVTVHREEGALITGRAFYAVPGSEDRYTYEPVAEVIDNEAMAEEVRKELLRQLRSVQGSLETFDSLVAGTRSARPSARAKKAVQTARRELEKAA